MIRSVRLVVGFVAFTLVGLFPGAIWAAIPASDRETKWEFYIPISYTSSESFSSDGGTSVDLNGDVGSGLGFGFNLNEKFNVGFEFTWLSSSYDANIFVDTPTSAIITVGGTLDASTGGLTAQFNLMEKAFTPFITAGFGWSFIDSNIPSGPAQTGCWWDPWYGYICTSWQPTATDTSFAYGAGVGLRGELTDTFFLEASYNMKWLDLDRPGTIDLSAYRLDIGWKF